MGIELKQQAYYVIAIRMKQLMQNEWDENLLCDVDNEVMKACEHLECEDAEKLGIEGYTLRRTSPDKTPTLLCSYNGREKVVEKRPKCPK